MSHVVNSIAYLASWAKYLYSRRSKHVRIARGQTHLVVTQGSWAATKMTLFVFLQHRQHTSACEDVARMYKTIQHLGCRLDELVLLFTERISRFHV